MGQTVASWRTLEGVEVECTHCGVRMTSQHGQKIRYFRCAGCHRWISSSYTEVLRGDAQMRTWPQRDEVVLSAEFNAAKGRLERWLAAVEDQDPYRALGVSPLDSPDVVRARYRELALERHPDRGGSARQMSELNDAYERILRHRARRAAEALTPRAAPAAPELPAARAR